MIELKNVSKIFDNNYVLKDISLKLPRYGIVSIFGPSGCGKTTLLNILSSLESFEGEISFNGKQYSLLNESDKDELRNTKIGFIFQDYKLFENETAERNLMLSLDIKSDVISIKNEYENIITPGIRFLGSNIFVLPFV